MGLEALQVNTKLKVSPNAGNYHEPLLDDLIQGRRVAWKQTSYYGLYVSQAQTNQRIKE
jgi:hypothetical protein